MLSDTSTSRLHEEINSKLLLYQYEVSQECSAFSGSKQGHYVAVQRSMSCVSILEVLFHLLHLYDNTIPLYCTNSQYRSCTLYLLVS